MARRHVMTPARRAALRKAQLASARKRRRRGVISSAKRAVRQKGQYAKASASVARNRHVGKKKLNTRAKRVLKYAAGGAAIGAAAGAAYGAHKYSTSETRLKRTIKATERHRVKSNAARRQSRSVALNKPLSRRLEKASMYHAKQYSKGIKKTQSLVTVRKHKRKAHR